MSKKGNPPQVELSKLRIKAFFVEFLRPSNSDFGYYVEEGESTGYIFTPPRVGSFACPGIDTQHVRYKESLLYILFQRMMRQSK
jgi:hypothetical protein